MMESKYYNTPEFISETLSGKHAQSEPRKLFLNTVYSIKTLFIGRKWLAYLVLTLIPILASLLSVDKYLGQPTATDAFVDNFIDTVILFLFSFGALLISLPHTSDEIADHMMEQYVVRPSRRDTIYLSRWIVSILGIWVVNTLVMIIYYVYFQVADGFSSSEFFNNLDILGSSILVLFFAALMYGSIFTFVGVIGSRGFTIGVLIAMFETFLISLVFLQNNKYIPRTNLLHLTDRLLGDYLVYAAAPAGMELWHNFLYFIAFTAITFVGGLYYFRQKQFEG